MIFFIVLQLLFSSLTLGLKLCKLFWSLVSLSSLDLFIKITDSIFLLKNILCTSYYPVYYSTEDCYVFYIEEYNEKTGYYNQTNLKYFLPKEYSDIYEEFIKTSNAHKVKWYTMDENGNKTSVNT